MSRVVDQPVIMLLFWANAIFVIRLKNELPVCPSWPWALVYSRHSPTSAPRCMRTARPTARSHSSLLQVRPCKVVRLPCLSLHASSLSVGPAFLLLRALSLWIYHVAHSCTPLALPFYLNHSRPDPQAPCFPVMQLSHATLCTLQVL